MVNSSLVVEYSHCSGLIFVVAVVVVVVVVVFFQ